MIEAFQGGVFHAWQDAGVEWVIDTIADNGHDGWDGRIAVAPSGEGHIVSIDPAQFGSASGIEWAVRNLAGQ